MVPRRSKSAARECTFLTAHSRQNSLIIQLLVADYLYKIENILCRWEQTESHVNSIKVNHTDVYFALAPPDTA
ncbi:hypothetical protein EA142_15780 [Citrobacter freundii]|nr:hypothetical protein C3391_19825 [Citrobacter freundii complex sp. CFNIH8]QAR65323.1 hypothetical protein C3B53_12270 [Citrobacter sp. SL156]QBI30558.1 hypothetical protein WN16_16105 [Citrobacter sp. ABFQG]RDT38181.1 hypothetical protein DXF86_18080 [Citrobacter freundii]RLZ47629.1 hypothetical protein EA142_15780 [Citrobacter freundii]